MIYHHATLLAVYAPSPFAAVWTVEFADQTGLKHYSSVEARFGRSLQEMEGLAVDILTSQSGAVTCVVLTGQLDGSGLQRLSSALKGVQYV